MTTAVDTNVISALWNTDDTLNRTAKEAIGNALGSGNVVISGAVHAELLAAAGRTEAFVDEFCITTRIDVEWELGETVWREAGRAFQRYATRRREQKGTLPRRLLADFVIGAHAWVNGYTLLTLDAGMYRATFPKLRVVAV